MSPAPLPSLDQLAADPARVRDLPPEVARDLFPKVAALHAALQVRAVSLDGAAQPEAPEWDRLLTPEEAAQILGVTVKWLYRHAKRFSFTRRLSRKCLRFSEAGLRKWQAAKRA